MIRLNSIDELLPSACWSAHDILNILGQGTSDATIVWAGWYNWIRDERRLALRREWNFDRGLVWTLD